MAGLPSVAASLRALATGTPTLWPPSELAAPALALARSGLLAPVRPDRLAGMALALARFGVTPATGYAAAAARWPDRAAVVDDTGVTTFAEVDRRSSALARALREVGLRPGGSVALLLRNSAAFPVAQVAAAKAGADVVYLNTGFAGPQLADTLAAEGADVLVGDDEFAGVLAAAAGERPCVLVRWGCAPLPDAAYDFDELARGDARPPSWSQRRAGRHVILTSGTTGAPKGAARTAPGLRGLEPVAALLSAIPLRARGVTVLAAPMFHAWGFAHLALAQLLGSTLVVTRRFDPARVLDLVAGHRADTLVAVPVMLQRTLAVPADAHDTSSLRVVAVSGSALPVPLAEALSERYGEVLYNLYGSTEVAYVSVATPADRRAAPGSVGRPLPGVRVAIVGEDGRELPVGEPGTIYAGNALSFAGYTGGQDKDRLAGLVSTGDVGHLDADGRLWIDGRSDDMAVTGGENVFPGEVEGCLLAHPAVRDVAVVAVPDPDLGQRLVAHVVADGVDAAGLRAHVKAHLAGYKAPREVVFHEALPRNETGKVLKRELAR